MQVAENYIIEFNKNCVCDKTQSDSTLEFSPIKESENVASKLKIYGRSDYALIVIGADNRITSFNYSI